MKKNQNLCVEFSVTFMLNWAAWAVVVRFMDETALIYLRVMCSFSFTVKSASSADSCFLDLCSCKTKYDSLNYLHGNVKVTFFTLHLISKQLSGLCADSSFSQCHCSGFYGRVLCSICYGVESWSWPLIWLSSCMVLL